jgi:enoyl-CoA hydratase/carnithine racemase
MAAQLEAVSTAMNERVAIVTFVPAADGTISNRGAALLAETVAELIADENVGAIILSSEAPGVFIRHAKVAQIVRAAGALARGEVDEAAFTGSPFARLCNLLDRTPKPVIAAIDGICMGGGFEIALACTMRIASPKVSHIGLPEIRIGIPPGAGGPQRLARLIGAHSARLFALQGRTIDAAEAERLGVIDRMEADVLVAAVEVARDIASRDPAVVSELMQQMRPDDAAEIEANLIGFARCLRRPAASKAMVAFLASGTALETLP